MPDARPLVIHHSPCLDGFTAAWACWLKYPQAEFVPGVHGQPPPDCAGRDVYLLDFSYKLPVMQGIVDAAKHVTILDHHKTAEADLSNLWSLNGGKSVDNVDCIFDMKKSGARLAWEWFHPNTEVPHLVRIVEDRDLWRFSLSATRELNAVFFSYDYNFERWSILREQCENLKELGDLVAQGCAIERKQQKDVRELVAKIKHWRPFRKVWNLHQCYIPCVNLPYTYASDAAGLMAETSPFAAAYYQDSVGNFVFSLRSKEGGADVSAVALAYGGGGHMNAAGFRVSDLESL